MKQAILLIAHGSRNPQANEDLVWLAQQLRERGFALVEPSYLELASPDILAAGKACIAQGAEEVVIVPYFLAAGVHVREDLTRFREELAREFPGIVFRLAPPLGRHQALVDLVAVRIGEAPPI